MLALETLSSELVVLVVGLSVLHVAALVFWATRAFNEGNNKKAIDAKKRH
ncbi:hypothetical protein H257_15803 [Aphanomyces astaci]|uniref:Uncharacterized protein n=1 Tax=Aphanomyces astaci TaxID=112090 RepID=W4FN25_APHAT|nr:hypothetical protein H257_15803 [Aphanomyces astaci]ETV68234.1 hypothetical protein H257_15803 [Aphanomyces astaci]|eukprot:XP_009842319.1 hypothetical protein H257_15803 [Aphanomyces astaci]